MSSDEIILRLSMGLMGLFGVIVFGALTLAIGFVIVVFIIAAFSGGDPTVIQ